MAHDLSGLPPRYSQTEPARILLLQNLLFWLFALNLLLAPFGQAFRVLMPLVCAVPLLALYVLDWPGRNLCRLPVRWLWLLFFALIAFEILASTYSDVSWKAVRPNLYRGYLLPFVAMECVRGERDLRRLTCLCLAAVLIEGLNGLWQFGIGRDLLTATEPLRYGSLPDSIPFVPGALESLRSFRLTGSMSTYRVGNYMALMLLPACGLFYLWPAERFARRTVVRLLLTLCLLSPALFLWVGAQARSGFLALAGGLYLAWALLEKPGKRVLIPPLLGSLAVLFGPERLSLSSMLADERTLIWSTAWRCFTTHPLLGTGANTFRQAGEALGLSVMANGSPLPPHPHNVYLQWLVDGGLIGFAGFSLWAFGLLVWSGRRIWQGLHRPGAWDGSHRLYWRLAVFFWAGWAGYLVNAFAAHDFYRTWWVSTAFPLVGVALGACARAPEPLDPTNPDHEASHAQTDFG